MFDLCLKNINYENNFYYISSNCIRIICNKKNRPQQSSEYLPWLRSAFYEHGIDTGIALKIFYFCVMACASVRLYRPKLMTVETTSVIACAA